jgi:5-methylcytosine-specific restriction endonuclease McrA
MLRLDGCTVKATVVDHRLNVARGGSDDDANLQAACEHCNERKRAAEARAR